MRFITLFLTGSTIILLIVSVGLGSYYLQTSSTLNGLQQRDSFYQSQLASIAAQVNALRLQVGNLSLQSSNQTKTGASLQTQLSDLRTRISSLQNSSALSSGTNSALVGNISSLQAQVNDLEAIVTGCAGSRVVNYIPYYQYNPHNIRPVFLLQPNSTVSVCVTYESSWHLFPNLYGNYSSFKQGGAFPNGTYTFTGGVYKIIKLGNCSCYAGRISHSFTFTILPSVIYPTEGTVYVTVLYEITSLSNSTGFYDGINPTDSLAAVGYSASQVNASDFPYAGIPHSGAVPIFIPLSVSVTGFNVTYLAIPIIHP